MHYSDEVASFEHLRHCFELTEADVAAAIETREATLALLQRLAQVSEPNSGAAKTLLVLARMATTACDWLDGDLVIEIRAEDTRSKIELQCELGLGMRERVLPPLLMNAPLEEFTRAIERVPRLVKPLAIKLKSASRLTLGAAEGVRRSSLPPPVAKAVRIATDSFFTLKVPPAPKAATEAGPAPALPVIHPQLPTVQPEERASAKVKLERPPVPRSSPPRVSPKPPPAKKPPSLKPAKSKPPTQRPPPRRDPASEAKREPVLFARDPRAEPEDEEAIDSGWDEK